MRMVPRAVTVFFLLGAVLLTGLGAVFLVKAGTSYLEKQHSSSRLQGTELGSRKRLPGWQTSALAHNGSVGREDFAAAFVTDLGHEDFIRFSRVWRQGLRTFVASNRTVGLPVKKRLWREHHEVWGHYPDDAPLHTLALKGDSRAALAPFLAYREIGESFKWMFYGDDDTFIFMDAAAKVVAGLDPELPYFLTDHMWWTEKWQRADGSVEEHTHHPHKAAPACVPCDYGRDTQAMPFPFPRGCPCTPQLICTADNKGIFFKGARGQCGIPRVPIRTYSVHGGAGAILSIGLLRRISFADFEDCVTTTYSTGGDALISICLWQVGFGMTAPDPAWHPDGLRMFDVGGEAQADHEDIVPRVAHVMGNLLRAAAGGCREGLCKLELEHFVTLHMRGRKFPSRRAHAEVSRALAGLADLAHGRSRAWAISSKNADEKDVDEHVAAALQALEKAESCQALAAGEQRAACLTGAVPEGIARSESSPEGDIGLLSRDLAAHIVRKIFERHPSPSGAYGDIPVGRE